MKSAHLHITSSLQDGIPTFSKGIWKSVSVVTVGSAAITAVVPQIFYSGEYPVAPLTDSTHKGFAVDVKVFTWAAKEVTGTLAVTGSWSAEGDAVTMHSQAVTIPKGNSSTTAKLTAVVRKEMDGLAVKVSTLQAEKQAEHFFGVRKELGMAVAAGVSLK